MGGGGGAGSYFAGPKDRSNSSPIALRPSSLRFRVPVAAKGRSGMTGVSGDQCPSVQVNPPGGPGRRRSPAG